MDKLILIIFLYMVYLCYVNNMIPETFWEIEKKREPEFEFSRLSKLYNKYKNENNSVKKSTYGDAINEEISMIYFSYPNYMHEKLDRYFYENYGL